MLDFLFDQEITKLQDSFDSMTKLLKEMVQRMERQEEQIANLKRQLAVLQTKVR